MNYREEAIHKNDIVCYWESHDMNGKTEYRYPSLPEPYINLFFPIDSTQKAQIKGISSKADYFKMKSKLFGVRLYLRGFYQLNLCEAQEISNKIFFIDDLAKKVESDLCRAISNSSNFDERVHLFENYFKEKIQHYSLTTKEEEISKALRYLMSNYRSANIIKDYALVSNKSERTLNRWFNEYIGISPKLLSQITRFNFALYQLHAFEEKGFYFDYGYFDQAHFIREFKKFSGKSPKEYVKFTSDLYN